MDKIKQGMEKVLSGIEVMPDQSLKELEPKSNYKPENLDTSLKEMFPPKFIRNDINLPVRFREYIPPCPRGLYLHGKTGTGKTQTSISISREFALRRVKDGAVFNSRKFSWMFLNYPKFVMRLQNSFRKDSTETAESLLSTYANIPYLIIDDLGAEKPTEFIRQSTYFLINEREMYERFTIITSNFSMRFLDENIDPRIASRIAGMCDVIELGGADRRLQK